MSIANRLSGRSVVAGVVAVALVAGAVPAAAAVPVGGGRVEIAMPALSGVLPVGTAELHLVDEGRVDPWRGGAREVMATVSYPAVPVGARAPWMSGGVAGVVDAITAGSEFFDIPVGSVAWDAARRWARVGAPAVGRWPVVVFSPGFGGPRELNAGLVDDLASRGYVVVSLSHTYESGVVEFPGGRVVTAAIDADAPGVAVTALEARVADSRFVVGELARIAGGGNPDAEGDPLPRGLGRAMDLSRLGMAGHSYGGFTAAEVMHQDRRVDAGVNLDGGFGGPDVPSGAVRDGLDRPFLLVGGDFVDPETGAVLRHDHLHQELDPTWARFWAVQRGWKRDLHFHTGGHYSFSDLQFALPQLRSLVPSEKAAAFIGTIGPAQSLGAQHDFLGGFFDLHLKGRDRRLFERDPHRYPDVRFVR